MPLDCSSAGGGEPSSLVEKEALLDLRSLLEDALHSNTLLLLGYSAPRHRRSRRRRLSAAPTSPPLEEEVQEEEADLSLWGVPLLPSRGHPATDAVLVKFLRARSLDPPAALEMLARSLRWRREFGADSLDLDEEAGDDVAVPVEGRIEGVDRMGNLVCYNVLKRGGVVVGEGEVVDRMVRWRVRLMERGIRETMRRRKKFGEEDEDGMMMLNVIDMEGVEARGVREVQGVMGRVVEVLQDNYPEFVERNIFINVSFRYYAHHALFSRFLTQRTKRKLIFARPSKVAETLLKFIAPENLPAQYGGLKREDDDEFPADQGEVFETSIRAGGYDTLEFLIAEPGVTVLWDVIVVGWDVSYKEEFIPDDECSYKVLIQKEKRLEENVRNSFYISEPGKVLLTIENNTFKRKKAYYRWKSKPTIPIYNIKK